MSIAIATVFLQCSNAKNKQSAETDNKSNSLPHDTVTNSNVDQPMIQSEKTLVIQGIFDSSGNQLVKIDNPVIYNRNLLRPTPDQLKGRYNVLIHYINGDSVKVPFDALVAGDRKDQISMHGFFELQIPLRKEDIHSIRIIETLPGKLLVIFRKEEIIYK
ncbi:MAG: hypothetical protein M3352_07310 [Bacteroidota bacterium]|nr:hypothetical protein [Bacteroidota bacterium]